MHNNNMHVPHHSLGCLWRLSHYYENEYELGDSSLKNTEIYLYSFQLHKKSRTWERVCEIDVNGNDGKDKDRDPPEELGGCVGQRIVD